MRKNIIQSAPLLDGSHRPSIFAFQATVGLLIRGGHMKRRVPKDVVKHCSGCWVYELRGRASEAMSDYMIESRGGETPDTPVNKWNFNECLNSCLRNNGELTNKQRKAKNLATLKRYHTNHPEARYMNGVVHV